MLGILTIISLIVLIPKLKLKTHRGAKTKTPAPAQAAPASTTSNEPPPRVPYTSSDAAAAVTQRKAQNIESAKRFTIRF